MFTKLSSFWFLGGSDTGLALATPYLRSTDSSWAC